MNCGHKWLLRSSHGNPVVGISVCALCHCVARAVHLDESLAQAGRLPGAGGGKPVTCFICETPRVNGFCPVHDDRKGSWMGWQRRVTGLAWPPLASGDDYRRIDHLRALEGRRG